MPEADASALIADDNQGCKTETPATLDHFCHTIDVNEPVDEFAVAIVTLSLSFPLRHLFNPILQIGITARQYEP